MLAITKDMIDQETGQREFLITGKNNFLEPYREGKKKVVGHINALHNLIDHAYDREEMLEDINQFMALITEWNKEIATPYIKSRQKGKGNINIQDMIEKQVEGKEQFDDMQKILARMEKNFNQAYNDEGGKLVLAISKNLIDHEQGLHGYLLTGKESFLTPYRMSQREIIKNITDLKKIISTAYDIHKARQMVDDIEELAQQWLTAAAEPEIRARIEMDKIQITMADVTKLIEAETGKNIIDKLR
ncbi:MAG: hypothetical protein GY821_13510 [Gammaproteobacteria bacterium]|nr:hypothetical protein [Gammaproteobacteria bacterium]